MSIECQNDKNEGSILHRPNFLMRTPYAGHFFILIISITSFFTSLPANLRYMLQTKFRIQIKPVSSVKHETRAVCVCVCATSLLVIVFNTKLGKKRKLCVEDGVQSVCVYIYFSNASISDTRICFFLHRNAQFNRDRKKVR